MEYGHIQAVVQLGVAVNIGVYTLKELSVPFLLQQRSDLSSLREFLGEVRDVLSKIQNVPDREHKEKEFEVLVGRMMSTWKASSKIRDDNSSFINKMVMYSGVFVILDLILLFYTAHNYGEKADVFTVFTAYISYVPMAAMVLIGVFIRRQGRILLTEQNSIRQAASRLI